MISPGLIQEWQRRQHQRGVLALLGLLAIVGGVPAPALAPAPPAVTEPSETVVVQPPSAAGRARAHDDVPRGYWAAFEPGLAARVRLTLRRHDWQRPAAARRAAYLRRFLRPPTTSPNA